MKIIVLNLNRTTTAEHLSNLFAEHGTVDSCELVMDKKTDTSKGFGFIEMPDETEATAAIAAIHGSRFGKNKLRAKQAD